MIVVGSRNSSNSVRLVEVALEHGARAGHLVDYADEIDESWLDGRVDRGRHVRRVACPRSWCARCSTTSRRAATATSMPVVAAEESIMFSLPNELRRDLKAAGKSDKMRHDASFAEAGSLH